MKKINILILVFMLTSFSLQISVHGLSMAAFSEKTSEQVERGETAEFFILFWNPEDEPFPVRLRATEVPEGLIVIITPNDFMLNSSLVTEFSVEKGGHYVNTPYGLMKTTPVRVLVKVPKTMELKSYDVVITATVGNPSGGVSALLEKKFKFTVDVVSQGLFETTQPETTTEVTTTKPTVGNETQGITGMFVAGRLTDFILLLISIIVLAFVIWFIRFRK